MGIAKPTLTLNPKPETRSSPKPEALSPTNPKPGLARTLWQRASLRSTPARWTGDRPLLAHTQGLGFGAVLLPQTSALIRRSENFSEIKTVLFFGDLERDPNLENCPKLQKSRTRCKTVSDIKKPLDQWDPCWEGTVGFRRPRGRRRNGPKNRQLRYFMTSLTQPRDPAARAFSPKP